GGKAGRVLDTITQVTQKEVKEDLRNFKRLIKGQQELGAEPSESEQAGEGIGRVLVSLVPPATGALAGGLAAYYLERRVHPSYSMSNLRHMLRNPRAYLNMGRLGLNVQRLGQDRLNVAYTPPAQAPWMVASWACAGLSAVSIATGA